MNITLILDYRNAFYSSTTNANYFCSMNVNRLYHHFQKLGISVQIIHFHEVVISDEWQGKIVIYQSSEDFNLRYKSYIEDIILGISLQGANVIPKFEFLRAHHNKVFMEILRDVLTVGRNLKSRYFGTFEEFKKSKLNYPSVVKISSGAGSSGVKLLNNPSEALHTVKKMMLSDFFTVWSFKELMKRIIRNNYEPYSLYRNKIIIQDFIPNLTHDFKVLVYGKRVFVVKREVRKNDFRASGSGILSWPKELPKGLLDFAWEIFRKCDVPHASFDVAIANNSFYLIEMQFVMFGSAALERTNHYWYRSDNAWELVIDKIELEFAFAEGIVSFIIAKGFLSNV